MSSCSWRPARPSSTQVRRLWSLWMSCRANPRPRQRTDPTSTRRVGSPFGKVNESNGHGPVTWRRGEGIILETPNNCAWGRRGDPLVVNCSGIISLPAYSALGRTNWNGRSDAFVLQRFPDPQPTRRSVIGRPPSLGRRSRRLNRPLLRLRTTMPPTRLVPSGSRWRPAVIRGWQDR